MYPDLTSRRKLSRPRHFRSASSSTYRERPSQGTSLDSSTEQPQSLVIPFDLSGFSKHVYTYVWSDVADDDIYIYWSRCVVFVLVNSLTNPHVDDGDLDVIL